MMNLHKVKECLHIHLSDISGSIYDDVNMSGSTIGNVNLAGCSFHNVNISGATFEDVNMSGWKVHDVNLSGLKIAKSNLQGATISESRLDGMTIDGILAGFAEDAEDEHGDDLKGLALGPNSRENLPAHIGRIDASPRRCAASCGPCRALGAPSRGNSCVRPDAAGCGAACLLRPRSRRPGWEPRRGCRGA
jgi:hypothetical protein